MISHHTPYRKMFSVKALDESYAFITACINRRISFGYYPFNTTGIIIFRPNSDSDTVAIRHTDDLYRKACWGEVYRSLSPYYKPLFVKDYYEKLININVE